MNKYLWWKEWHIKINASTFFSRLSGSQSSEANVLQHSVKS